MRYPHKVCIIFVFLAWICRKRFEIWEMLTEKNALLHLVHLFTCQEDERNLERFAAYKDGYK